MPSKLVTQILHQNKYASLDSLLCYMCWYIFVSLL